MRFSLQTYAAVILLVSMAVGLVVLGTQNRDLRETINDNSVQALHVQVKAGKAWVYYTMSRGTKPRVLELSEGQHANFGTHSMSYPSDADRGDADGVELAEPMQIREHK